MLKKTDRLGEIGFLQLKDREILELNTSFDT